MKSHAAQRRRSASVQGSSLRWLSAELLVLLPMVALLANCVSPGLTQQLSPPLSSRSPATATLDEIEQRAIGWGRQAATLKVEAETSTSSVDGGHKAHDNVIETTSTRSSRASTASSGSSGPPGGSGDGYGDDDGDDDGVMDCSATVKIVTPPVVLHSVKFTINITLAPYYNNSAQLWPETILYALYFRPTSNQSSPTVIAAGNWSVFGPGAGSRPTLSFLLTDIDIDASGSTHLALAVDKCAPIDIAVNIIPEWLSIFPTILCIVLAIALRQVLCALVLGTWLGTLFIEDYNPLSASLRTADRYVVNAFGSRSHAAIILFTFQLGGLIGLVQKSGGALGLSKLFTKFTTTPFRACLACLCLAILVFFDDYSSILIVGSSLRSVMEALHVPREKFAFIVHAMGPSLTSFSPVSSWIAVQLGYISSAYGASGVSVDSFVLYLETIPYRAFPILMIVFVIIIICTQRDFGPMLRAKPHTQGLLLSDHDQSLEEPTFSGARARSASSASYVPIELANPLSPRDSTPLRWFNAAIPFLTVIVLTFVGMYLSGIAAIENMPAGVRPNENAENIFSNADSMDALIWSSLAGCFVALLMILVQRILSLSEALQALISGVKEVVEPTVILVLAWALGDVINELQTGEYLAKLIGTDLDPIYLPTIVILVAYLMSYATGTSFGSMGIMFPLVIPIICKLTDDEGLRRQTSAAILGGCVFGNVVSPIADNTILTSIATKCDLNAHIKTETLYVCLVGAVSVLFCTLPVGIGAYPIYAGLPIAALALLLIVVVFGSTDIESESLFERYVCCSARRGRSWSMISSDYKSSSAWFSSMFSQRRSRPNYESIN